MYVERSGCELAAPCSEKSERRCKEWPDYHERVRVVFNVVTQSEVYTRENQTCAHVRLPAGASFILVYLFL